MDNRHYSISQLKDLVSWQLGRVPEIDFEVEALCEYGWPAVIRNSPYNTNGFPNANLYYLSCPYLRIEIARLEDSGAISELEDRINSRKILRDDLVRCQVAHQEEWRRAAEKGLREGIRESNYIAGVSEVSRLKCLHAHFAFFLAHRDYLAGALIADSLGSIWCDDERCCRWKGTDIDNSDS